MIPTPSLLKLPRVLERTAQGVTKLYADVKAGLFTPPVKRDRTSAWPAHEVDAIVAARIAGATDEDIRRLVRRLVQQRASLMPPTSGPQVETGAAA